ncbi:uncharacterized protein MEPE_06007 [Melanopsichium pennsylvanicum]|uniref:Enoyl reductase (ER) domain-containing protein n=2 Tax=Melanopsichium pennsylvanicum TaxID=63383 RepID=A0AAJ4XSX9_9BASI|nr:zinc-binding dehydrogenase [Melanopsichium pennsylvanicum 4]SNX87297.1 uncharacterized protein MEPE_06007 [Melanopsichium pennsylvanicum]
MAEVEIIDTEIVPQHSQLKDPIDFNSKLSLSNDVGIATLTSVYPVYTQAERETAHRLLVPSAHDVVLGAGWVDTQALDSTSDGDASDSKLGRRVSSASSSSSFSSPSTPPAFSLPAQSTDLLASTKYPSHSDALLVRSCSQGWTLSFELTSSHPTPLPLAPDEVLISNTAVGLNPVDWKSVSFNFGIPAFPWVLGRDIVGTIVQTPADNSERWKSGDRVWTCADSREMRAGAYQRYSVHKKGTLAPVPERVEDEQAATLGTGLITAAVALFAFFKLPFAPLSVENQLEKIGLEENLEGRGWILIYGGGAVTGIYAAQLASISKLRVISVASPSNFSYLSSNGVTECIDRHQPYESIISSISSIIASGGGRLRYAMDCVSSSTADLCLQALKDNGADQAELICLAGNPKAEPEQVKVHKISFSTTFYHPNGEFARDVLEYVTELLKDGALKPCRPEVLPDGLAGIRAGLEMLREGRAPRAKKLVVRVKDTPAADVTLLGVRGELGWNGVV